MLHECTRKASTEKQEMRKDTSSAPFKFQEVAAVAWSQGRPPWWRVVLGGESSLEGAWTTLSTDSLPGQRCKVVIERNQNHGQECGSMVKFKTEPHPLWKGSVKLEVHPREARGGLWARASCRFRLVPSIRLFSFAKHQPLGWCEVISRSYAKLNRCRLICHLMSLVFWLFFLFILVHVGTIILSTIFTNMS